MEATLKQIQKYYSLLPDENRVKSVSVLDIFNKTYSEDYISDFLAYILHPKLNGIGLEPLRKLVEATGGEWREEFEATADEVSIKREFTFNNSRRIDLLINVSDSFIIGIEHKVFSEEHGKQTVVYAEKIEELFPHHQHLFIFLTHDKREPIAKDKFKAVGYEDLIVVLRSVQFDYLKDVKKSVLYQDFITHLEDNFMKKETLVLSERSKLYIENAKMIEDLRKSFESDYEEILYYTINLMKNQLENFDGNEWYLNVEPKRSYHQILNENWKFKGLDIHFEFSISKKNLILNPSVDFRLDIEGPGKKDFIEILETNYSDRINCLVQEHHLKKHPRSITLVSKEYELLTMENIENQHLLQSQIEVIFNEFKGFIGIINEALTKF